MTSSRVRGVAAAAVGTCHAAAVMLLLVISLLSCEPEAPDRPEPPSPAEEPTPMPGADGRDADPSADGLGDREEEARLLLIQEIPLGITHAELRERLPAVGMLLPEGPADVESEEALGEATLPTRVLGYDARLEFNFRRDTLYSYYYWLDDLGCDRALGMYRRLRRFYDERLGSSREEIQREPGYESRSAFWTPADWSVVATLGLEGEVCRLAWGFQAEQP